MQHQLHFNSRKLEMELEIYILYRISDELNWQLEWGVSRGTIPLKIVIM